MKADTKAMRRSKLPVVKAKVGPRVMSLIADEQIFDEIPLKKEVKASISGMYITAVRGIRGPLEKPKEEKRLPCKKWQKTTARPMNSSRLRRLQRLKEKLLKRLPKRLRRNNIMI